MRMTGKWGLIVGVILAVSGCQTPPQGSSPATTDTQRAPAQSSQGLAQVGQGAPLARTTDERQVIETNAQAADLRIFLADTQPRPGWVEISLKPSGVLHVNTAPVITRADLIGIQSGTDQAGGGVLVLALSDEGLRKLHAATAANPGLRLALVVGQTMLAAPGYASPIRERQLAFGVGSRRNAEIAARAVAGVESAPPTFGQ